MMLPVLVYCASVFIILILYYFYKPIDESLVETKQSKQTQNELASTYHASSNTLKSQFDSASLASASNTNTLSKRNINKDLIRCDSSMSIRTTNSNNCNNDNLRSVDSISSLSCENNNSVVNNSNESLWKKITSLYNMYILCNLAPIYKYLGLNDSTSNSDQRNLKTNSSINNPTISGFSNQIEDNYKTLDELLAELNKLDILNFQQNVNEALFNFDTNSLLNTNATHHEYSCNIIIGVDFTASNEWKGRKTFNSQSLHKTLGNKTYNPYQKVISVLGFVVNKLIIANSVSSYSNPNNSNNSDTQQSLINTGLKIHAYGFGDQSTTDKSVFQLFEHQNQDSSALGSDFYYVDSFEEVLTRYNDIVKRINLSGPTSFAPIIYKSIEVMRQRQQIPFHILFIITDGKVSDENESDTIKAIIEASQYPLSIVVIGVGDGPWNTMIKFDDRLCTKSKFDNFQFVDYHQTVKNSKTPDTALALKALMEIPDQYKIMKQLNYI